MKQIITVTFKDGKTVTSPYKDLVIGETNIDITYPEDDKERVFGGDIILKKVKEIKIT